MASFPINPAFSPVFGRPLASIQQQPIKSASFNSSSQTLDSSGKTYGAAPRLPDWSQRAATIAMKSAAQLLLASLGLGVGGKGIVAPGSTTVQSVCTKNRDAKARLC